MHREKKFSECIVPSDILVIHIILVLVSVRFYGNHIILFSFSYYIIFVFFLLLLPIII